MPAFWDEASGALQLLEGARLHSHMHRQEVLAVRQALLGDAPAQPPPADGAVVPMPAFAVPGGRLAGLCILHGDKLHAVELSVVSVGQRRRGTAEQQRAFLFQCLRAADPSPDSQRNVLLRCPFGTALIATDPRTGDATLRLTYR